MANEQLQSPRVSTEFPPLEGLGLIDFRLEADRETLLAKGNPVIWEEDGVTMIGDAIYKVTAGEHKGQYFVVPPGGLKEMQLPEVYMVTNRPVGSDVIRPLYEDDPAYLWEAYQAPFSGNYRAENNNL